MFIDILLLASYVQICIVSEESDYFISIYANDLKVSENYAVNAVKRIKNNLRSTKKQTLKEMRA